MATDNTLSRSTVDIRLSIEDARQATASAGCEDGPYGELMATYVELGELLDSGRADVEYEQECRALVDRLIVLGKANERHWDQKWAAWAAENTTFGGDVW
ncbi:hypothetical protein [Actinocrispum wychmicini]|uniref:Excreted virulence factor EspC (Type VII ESX diderm) n=1 Tax=Actinocrispum wychmicini TaxID=1213861 RepID=A0A4R2K3I8_9PSEU|nr:hypothetical protein [Actinocrispum wychmicini]TCO64366.1 hypothetical protein EV192_101134 [Actinocrispum wychmicini]